jgi:hypothetical protein
MGFRNYNNHRVVDRLPETCWWARAWINAQERLINTSWAWYMVIPDKTPPSNIDEARRQLLAEAQWAVEWLEQIGELEHLAAGIQTGTTIAIADGSFKDLRGMSSSMETHINVSTGQTKYQGKIWIKPPTAANSPESTGPSY